ncbi:MAG: EAL domain-containing protein [Steroidobacteraceae bacterium]|nr:EAL domain-containing protein [Nevskiaceae bacterium]MCP5339944.1 EAL domain-containing protein [Nevskiaceae bacterium]MCP5471033.1 EAL domain-containing protein [Nevskiaceae bacterium]
MNFFAGFAHSPTWRRFAVALVVCAVLPLMLLALVAGREQAERSSREGVETAQARAQTLSSIVAARLTAADIAARAFIAGDSAKGVAALQSAAIRSGLFQRVIVDDGRIGLPVPLGSRPSSPARTGEGAKPSADTALVSLATRGDMGSAYLVRMLYLDGRELPAYFELAPDWLWPAATDREQMLLVVDGRGTMLFGANTFPADGNRVVRAHVLATPATRLSWQAQGQEWQGAVEALRLPASIQSQDPWYVVAATPLEGGWSVIAPVRAEILLPLLLLAAVAMLSTSAIAANRFHLSLMELRGALLRIGRNRFVPAPTTALPAELLPLGTAINDIGQRIDEDVMALETLGDIDRLLLGAVELEPVLDAILSRVSRVTHCHCAGIALLDADSPTLGRVYRAGESSEPLPVSRVEFDPELIEALTDADEGVTIARAEPVRHSFLVPLRELGAEFFWVWPVVSGGRLPALLAVGFRETPTPDPRFARYGSEFASRLAIALSKTARDEHLYRQAHYDPLTGLPNRLLFCDRLTQEVANSAAEQYCGALLYIDLDHFKRVNDSVGHAAGDQLLTIIAQRLRACVKEGDTVARLAGDEFTVILRKVDDPESASVVAERIIESVKLPVNLAGRDHYVQASIGIVLFPDDGVAIDELMRRADSAMYRAKGLGRSRAVFYDHALMASRLETSQSGLYRALRRREFSLFYQPQFSLDDGSLVGLEALLRWQTPRDGTRSPRDFIPAAEVSGLIVDIGGWVVDAACAQLAIWREQGIAPTRLSINVSVQQLKYVDFARNVRRILDKYGIPPKLVEIEMTESVFADEVAGAVLRQLADLGVRLALDDFGTGYSSLNYLRQHPIHVVKIDRSFLEDIPANAASATLAETIINMAHALGKEVVAEGVETLEQLQFLRERRCDSAQGFFLAQPMPVSQVSDLLQARRRPGPMEETLRQAG